MAIKTKIYDFDLINLAHNCVPIEWMVFDWFMPWIKVLVTPLQWLKDKAFINMLNGLSASTWSNVTNYTVGQKVRYGQSIYECLVENTNITPTNYTYWTLYVQDRIGVRERLGYSCEQLKLEYALNKRFETEFRQPINAGLRPDIYITLNNIVDQFIVFQSVANAVFDSGSDGFIYDNVLNTNPYNVTINVPDIPLFSNMGADLQNIVGSWVKKYICESIRYEVVIYNGLPPTY